MFFGSCFSRWTYNHQVVLEEFYHSFVTPSISIRLNKRIISWFAAVVYHIMIRFGHDGHGGYEYKPRQGLVQVFHTCWVFCFLRSVKKRPPPRLRRRHTRNWLRLLQCSTKVERWRGCTYNLLCWSITWRDSRQWEMWLNRILEDHWSYRNWQVNIRTTQRLTHWGLRRWWQQSAPNSIGIRKLKRKK